MNFVLADQREQQVEWPFKVAKAEFEASALLGNYLGDFGIMARSHARQALSQRCDRPQLRLSSAQTP
jgi:hypothetical protein